MQKRVLDITSAQLTSACRYIEQQMQAHSWWPKEQPGQARDEFNLMKGQAANLNVWCERWLDAGQQKHLQQYLLGND